MSKDYASSTESVKFCAEAGAKDGDPRTGINFCSEARAGDQTLTPLLYFPAGDQTLTP